MPSRKDQVNAQKPTHVRTKERVVQIERVGAFNGAEVQRLMAELAIYQAELEAQNDELRLTEVRLELERRRYSDLFMSAPIGYLTLDRTQKIVQINDAALRLLGRPQNLIVGQPLALYVSAVDLPRFRDCLSAAANSPANQTCEVNLRLDGRSPLPVVLNAGAITATDLESTEVTRITLIDMSAHVAAEQHQREMLLHFNRLSSELMATSAEMESIAHSMSGELDVPLAVITEALKSSLAGEDAQPGLRDMAQAETVRQAVNQVNKLTEQLQHLTSLGTHPLMLTDVDMTALSLKIIDELYRQEPSRKVEVTVAPDLYARGDRRLLELILANLLSNAWKYTRKCAEPRIVVDIIANAAGRQVFFVRDNGVGFNMHDAGKLFTPFQRLHSEEEYPGAAMGLPIVARAIRRHGGTIWAESEPGKGAVFYFTIGA